MLDTLADQVGATGLADTRRWRDGRLAGLPGHPLVLVVLWLVLALTAYHQYHQAVSGGEFGDDFGAVWVAAHHLAHGQSIYADTTSGGGFVYLPSAALLFLPFTALSLLGAAKVWVVICLLAMVGACLIVVRTLNGPGWLAPISALVMVNSSAGQGLHVTNVDLVLPLLVALMTWAVASDRPVVGALANGLSVAIKPLIVAPWVLMVLQRRWRAFAYALVIPVLSGLIVLALVPDAAHFVTHTIPFLSGSENAVTQRASVAVASVLASAPAALRVTVRVLVVVVGLGVSGLIWRRPASDAVRWLEVVVALQITVELASGFAFSHHLALVLLLIPAAGARDALARRWPVMVALLIFALPKLPDHAPHALVVKDCLSLLLVLVTLGLAAALSLRTRVVHRA